MSSTDSSTEMPEVGTIAMKLEVVTLPVSDVDRAKRFYQSLGWRLDADFAFSDDVRGVQLTPPHSGCSIHFGTGITTAEPGSVQRVVLAVDDIDAAREDLLGRGVEVSELFHREGGEFPPGPDPERGTYMTYASFSDPDGNGWLLQEIKVRLPGRASGMATRYDGASDLSKALLRAAMAHGEHEARTGEADPDWPDWYAEYMVRERAGEELPV
jgi:catechol 2,3-dioxygenase-like lactoylglutathione lyase family enzyme